MQNFIILRGTTGMGKSYLSKQLEKDHGAVVCSNDRWWLQPQNKGRRWQLSTHCDCAIPWCANKCTLALMDKKPLVILDNLNMKLRNFRVLTALAEKKGYKILVISLMSKSNKKALEAVSRNIRPGWDQRTINRMAELRHGYETFRPTNDKNYTLIERFGMIEGDELLKWILNNLSLEDNNNLSLEDNAQTEKDLSKHVDIEDDEKTSMKKQTTKKKRKRLDEGVQPTIASKLPSKKKKTIN